MLGFRKKELEFSSIIVHTLFSQKRELAGLMTSADEHPGGNSHKERLDFPTHRAPVDFATECDELEGSLLAHTLGIAICRARGLSGTVPDTLLAQALGEGAWHISGSRSHLDGFEKFHPLWFRKAQHNPSQSSDESTLISGF